MRSRGRDGVTQCERRQVPYVGMRGGEGSGPRRVSAKKHGDVCGKKSSDTTVNIGSI